MLPSSAPQQCSPAVLPSSAPEACQSTRAAAAWGGHERVLGESGAWRRAKAATSRERGAAAAASECRGGIILPAAVMRCGSSLPRCHSGPFAYPKLARKAAARELQKGRTQGEAATGAATTAATAAGVCARLSPLDVHDWARHQENFAVRYVSAGCGSVISAARMRVVISLDVRATCQQSPHASWGSNGTATGQQAMGAAVGAVSCSAPIHCASHASLPRMQDHSARADMTTSNRCTRKQWSEISSRSIHAQGLEHLCERLRRS